MLITHEVNLPRPMRGTEIIEAVKAGADEGQLYLNPPREGARRREVGRVSRYQHEHVLVGASKDELHLEDDRVYEQVFLGSYIWGDVSILFEPFTDKDKQDSVAAFYEAFKQQLTTKER